VDPKRYKTIKLLVRKVNKERRQQAKKIDILCNNLVEAQRDFIKRLNAIAFAANFYESIVGITDFNSLLYTAGKIIRNELPNANIAFFLRGQDNFELHLFENNKPIALEKQHLENCFTPEVVDNICKANKICTLDDMFAMGLQGNLCKLNKISALAVPLSRLGSAMGFILIYHLSQNKLNVEELNNITSVTLGLARALQNCNGLSRAAK
jgi:hypothetical protein